MKLSERIEGVEIRLLLLESKVDLLWNRINHTIEGLLEGLPNTKKEGEKK